jgi:predicted ATPase with chaperone activity
MLTYPREIECYCALSDADHRLLEQALERLGFSSRAYHRVKVHSFCARFMRATAASNTLVYRIVCSTLNDVQLL